MSDTTLWRRIVGQDNAIEKIRGAIDSGSQSHAWLFVGPRGVGKWTVAKALAAALNCEDGGCGECLSCAKVLREIHPDFFLIEPEGNFILIEQIEELLQSVSRKNYEGATKVIIIDEADRMTAEAANALLKTLEEPPAHVAFVLITSNADAVLPTIASRCRVVQFKAIPARDMVSFLIERHGATPTDAELATRLSGGILGAAISFLASPAKQHRRRVVLGIMRNVDRSNLAQVSFFAEELMRELKAPINELKEEQKREISELKERFGPKDKTSKQAVQRLEQRHKREIGREERQGFEEILGIAASWFRDVLLIKETGRDDVLTNRDHAQLAREHADLLSSEDMCRCLRIIEETRQYLRFNVNMQLAFETTLFKIYDVVAVKGAAYLD